MVERSENHRKCDKPKLDPEGITAELRCCDPYRDQKSCNIKNLCYISRLGDSPGFRWGTVAIAKTAYPNIFGAVPIENPNEPGFHLFTAIISIAVSTIPLWPRTIVAIDYVQLLAKTIHAILGDANSV